LGTSREGQSGEQEKAFHEQELVRPDGVALSEAAVGDSAGIECDRCPVPLRRAHEIALDGKLEPSWRSRRTSHRVKIPSSRKTLRSAVDVVVEVLSGVALCGSVRGPALRPFSGREGSAAAEARQRKATQRAAVSLTRSPPSSWPGPPRQAPALPLGGR